ncbi:MAG: acetyltransferase [Planctomycetota bacterium]|jgi:sugar O-acyltransferase (sialic acid O-acetyltransferase NeuD family)
MLGAGGHAKSCQDIIDSFRDYSISLKGRIRIGFKVNDTRKLSKGSFKSLAMNHDGFVLGVGQIHSPKQRIKIAFQVLSAGGQFATLISPYARVSPQAKIGKGVVVMPNASINAGAEIGDYCIINTGAIIEHDARVGEFCHIATGAVVNGDCKIGKCCFIGSNAVLLNQMEICKDTTVGAGSVVTKRITEPGGIYVGNPATFLRQKT